MTNANDAHLGPRLLAYLDDELTPAERREVEAHLARCPGCAAELEELRGLRLGIGVTVGATLSSIRLSRDSDDRIRQTLIERVERRERAPWWWQTWAQRLRFAQAALAVVLVAFSASALSLLRLPAPAAPQEVLVFGQDRLAPGSQAAYRVVVRNAAPVTIGLMGSPVAGVEVLVGLLSRDGDVQPLYEGQTDALGTAAVSFVVPESAEGRADLVVETRSQAGEERLVREINIARSYKTYLMTDKPAYRPGQTIHLRGLVLDSVDLLPASGAAVHFSVLDGAGTELGTETASLSGYGVAAWDFVLPAGAYPGVYTVRALVGDTVSERSVSVGDYELPAFRATLETDASYYGPGDLVRGTVDANAFIGAPVSDAAVRIWAYGPGVPRSPVPAFEGRTDGAGLLRFTLELPDGATSGLLALECEVVDNADRVVGIRRLLPLSDQAITIQAMPESGVLKSGVENTVYVMTAYPDGSPAATTLAVEGEGLQLDLETGSHGLTSFTFVPRGDTVLAFSALDSEGAGGNAVLTLGAEDGGKALLLHTDAAVYQVGQTLRVRALVSGESPGAVYLDVVRAGQMVAGLASEVVEGRAEFALDLDPGLMGALELRAYLLPEDGVRIEDSRLVVVDGPRDVDVALTTDRQRYQPGDTAHLEIATREGGQGEAGAGVPAAVAISVVDESVFSLETLPPSFARIYFLATEAMLAKGRQGAGLDLPTVLDQTSPDASAQDMAARASWAGIQPQQESWKVRTLLTPVNRAAAARQRLSQSLTVAIVVLPVLLCLSVIRHLQDLGLVGQALKRLLLAVALFVLISPLLIVGIVVGLLIPAVGATFFFVVLVAVVGLLLAITIQVWRHRDERMRLASGFILCYLVLAGMLLGLAAQGAAIAGVAVVAVVGAFLVLVASALLAGQALTLTGRKGTGWAVTVLALLLVLLAVGAPAVPSLRSELSRGLGSPTLYLGPLGWLTGCSAATPASKTVEPESTEAPAAAEATSLPRTAEPTPMPQPTATAPLVPAELYPLRQVFPETLYWDPEAETDTDGNLSLDLVLADSVTAWRVSALASTQDGKIGWATHDIVVAKDLFVTVDTPETPRFGEPLTLTIAVYNALPTPQTVRWGIASAGAFEDLVPPQPVTVDPESATAVTWVIRPEAAGSLPLVIAATSEYSVDRVLVELQVEDVAEP